MIPAYHLRMTVTRALFALALLAVAAGCDGQPSAPAKTPATSTVTPATSTVTPAASTTVPVSSTTAPSTLIKTPVVSPSSTGNVDGFIAALRAGGVPVSESGEPERLIGRGVCQQIHAGSSPDKLAHDLTASGYTLAQAATLVSAAQENFCG
jgi:Protein of unknown function (DUF732)